MAGRAGQASAWPVPSDAGFLTPVRSATHPVSERRVTGLSLSEGMEMTYPPFAPGHRPLRPINTSLQISEFSVSLFCRLKSPPARVKNRHPQREVCV